MPDRSLTPAERYAEQVRGSRAETHFSPKLDADGRPCRVFRGPRGEAGEQPIYRNQVPERAGEDR
jgi:hypothetical protein